ncbi:hypothetical protein GQ53DRAFT_650031 [Thozetella sp. PMI_491]|nr:hypothetical protein GQ53DRAFT_650031 [Thozetella sp. PMI_491]
MAKPITMSCQIEIQATPERVRSIFLDFARYSEWQDGWAITPETEGRESTELQKGDTLKIAMHGMSFHSTVAENRPEVFVWEGKLPGLLAGKHFFHFTPSEEHPGGTTFIQTEEFRGFIPWLMKPIWNEKKATSDNWDAFNAALKKAAEDPAR